MQFSQKSQKLAKKARKLAKNILLSYLIRLLIDYMPKIIDFLFG